MNEPQLRIRGLTRRFAGNDRAAVNDLNLDVARGEVVCLVGPSGCGKSTTLRLVAGLDQADAGQIEIAGRSMQAVAPQARDVAMVFQGFALYPHMTVREILGFPLKMRRIAGPERRRAVEAAAELLGIARLLERRPAELSGGEQQRVAMGRAIVRRPQLFLFDEPLSNLDAALRAELRLELAKLLRDLEATALYVTHDQIEAMTLGRRIAVLQGGKIEQLDSPRRIYEAPASTFVAGFFGTPPMNLLPVARRESSTALASFEFPLPNATASELVLGIRPEHLRLVSPSEGQRTGASELCRLRGAIAAVEPLGAESHVALEVAGHSLSLRVPGFDTPALGSHVEVEFLSSDIRWFDRRSGLAL